MPNRYEREIEEILRNLEQTEPKPGLGQRLSARLRPKPGRRSRSPKFAFPAFHLSWSEWLLVIAVLAMLISGGYAYAQGEANVGTGSVALIGAVCLILVALSSFFRSSRSTQSTRYGNVTPLRRNPLASIQTRWNLFLLKLHYRRNRSDHS